MSKLIGLETQSVNLASAEQLLATNYFNFLEANGFLKSDTDFLYGDLLQSTPPAFEEPVLILLTMFRTPFPAGNTIHVPQSHQRFLLQESGRSAQH